MVTRGRKRRYKTGFRTPITNELTAGSLVRYPATHLTSHIAQVLEDLDAVMLGLVTGLCAHTNAEGLPHDICWTRDSLRKSCKSLARVEPDWPFFAASSKVLSSIDKLRGDGTLRSELKTMLVHAKQAVVEIRQDKEDEVSQFELIQASLPFSVLGSEKKAKVAERTRMQRQRFTKQYLGHYFNSLSGDAKPSFRQSFCNAERTIA